MRIRPAPICLALTLALLAPASTGASVLYVGDSLGVGTAPPLREQLTGVAIDVDAKTSRPSGVGVEVLSASIVPEHEVVVFDLGTNDDPAAPEVLASDLAQAREIAGDRCLVVATLNRPPLNGVSADGLNRAVTRFAAQSPEVELVDWRGAAAASPELLTDGVHATPEGYALRAQLFADAIGACLAFGDTSATAPPPQPEPAAQVPKPTAPKPPPPPRELDPVRAVALELAKTIAIGAEFG